MFQFETPQPSIMTASTKKDDDNSSDSHDVPVSFAAANGLLILGGSSIMTNGSAGERKHGGSLQNSSSIMNSSSIFSMEHLQTSIINEDAFSRSKDDNLLVDSTGPYTASSPSAIFTTKQAAEETASVVSDNNSIHSVDASCPFKPFWRNGTLKNGDELFDAETEEAQEEQPPVAITSSEEENESGSYINVVLGAYHSMTAKMSTWIAKYSNNIGDFSRSLKAYLVELMDYLKTSGNYQGPMLWLLCFVVVCLTRFASGNYPLFQWTTKPMATEPLSIPKSDLKSFVLFEKAKQHTSSHLPLSEEDGMENLQTDVFKSFARTACVKAGSVDATRDALFSNLKGVPESIRKDLVEMAVQPEVTLVNSWQDTKADTVEEGTAYSFMAFFSTAFRPRRGDEDQSNRYESCIMVTGVSLTVAETVAEWSQKQERYQVGVKPCHCGTLIHSICIFSWPAN